MNKIALTSTEQQFAEDHHGLIYSFLNSKNLNDDDYYDIVVFGYLSAIQRYMSQPKLRKYSFSTIGWQSMERSLSNHYKSENRQKRRAFTVSLDSVEQDCGRTHLHSYVSAPDLLLMDFETELLLHELASRVSEQEMNIISMRLYGYGTREIASAHKMPMKGVVDLLAGLQETVLSVCYG